MLVSNVDNIDSDSIFSLLGKAFSVIVILRKYKCINCDVRVGSGSLTLHHVAWVDADHSFDYLWNTYQSQSIDSLHLPWPSV